MHKIPKISHQTQKPLSTSAIQSHLSTGEMGQREHPLHHLQHTIGNQAVQWMVQSHAAPGVLQTKLAINQPGDIYEQEADHVAEQVMRMPEPQLQRACACGGTCSGCQGEQAEQAHEQEQLQMKRVDTSSKGQGEAPSSINSALASPGQPLDAETLAFMQPRFGHDFSSVRVHSGTLAEQSAQDVNARAYTVGQDMVFGKGWFAPGTHAGRRLLAHELTHVVQQSGSQAHVIRRSPVSPDGPPVNEEILGASASTSETVVLYHYGDLEGRETFNSPPGYPRLTDCDIANTQVEASKYTGTPINSKLVNKYALKIDSAYFEKHFRNTGTRGAYSEFVTKEAIPTKYFRMVLKLTPTSPIAGPPRGSTTPAGGTARAVTSANGEITVPTTNTFKSNIIHVAQGVGEGLLTNLLFEYIDTKIKEQVDKSIFEKRMKALLPQIEEEKRQAFEGAPANLRSLIDKHQCYWIIQLRITVKTAIVVAGRGSRAMAGSPNPELLSIRISESDNGGNGPIEEKKPIVAPALEPVILLENSQIVTYSEPIVSWHASDIDEQTFARMTASFAANRRPQEPHVSTDALRFSATGKAVTDASLLAWAKRTYPHGLDIPALLKSIYNSHEFSGSDDARERAAVALVLKLRDEQSPAHSK